MNESEIRDLATRLESAPPQAILERALGHYPELAVSFSGAEDVVLVDMAVRVRPDVHVFSLDTGRLHPETYRYVEEVRERYDLPIEVLTPQHGAVQELVRDKGLFSFYREGHRECCAVRKVEPLRRRLASLDAWVTGQRRDQSVGTRNDLPVLQIDPAFSAPGRPLVKFNPLSLWTSEQVWKYIREHDVPFNALHQQGFVSIGCEPCTRPVLPGQHEREGRWWWEDAGKKECGLHAGNLGVVRTA